ncbi:PIF1-like helicase-domain-containing protein [Chytridium lagenaria]|nr:PIF1-like helicase-domain-containing protein [Chytridium lagenaria]
MSEFPHKTTTPTTTKKRCQTKIASLHGILGFRILNLHTENESASETGKPTSKSHLTNLDDSDADDDVFMSEDESRIVENDIFQQIYSVQGHLFPTTLPTTVEETADNIPDRHLSVNEIELHLKRSSSQSLEDPDDGTSEILRRYQDADFRRTLVEKINASMQDIPYRPTEPGDADIILSEFPSIAEVSQKHTLNEIQHAVFRKAASYLLLAYLEDIEEFASSTHLSISLPNTMLHLPNNNPQEIWRSYVGGEGGTGKSRIIAAIQDFANKWRRTNSVETFAFTGTAAEKIDGITMHSGRGIGVGKDTIIPSSITRRRAASSRLLIIDEISMVGRLLLGDFDKACRVNAETEKEKNESLGGKHCVIFGDFHQLEPVRQQPCFRPPDPTTNEKEAQGFETYSTFDDVYFLIENHRQKNDVVYAGILNEVRKGNIDDESLRLLNSRVIADINDSVTRRTREEDVFLPVVVGLNVDASQIRKQLTLRLCPEHQTLFTTKAVPLRRSSRTRHLDIHRLKEHETDFIPMTLMFNVGMPVYFTRKVTLADAADAKPLATKGTIGIIIAIDLDPEERSTNLEGTNQRFLSHLPTRIWVKIRDSKRQYYTRIESRNGVRQEIQAPKGVVPICPQKLEARCKVGHVNFTKTVLSFPFISFYATTPEKLQGLTLPGKFVPTREATPGVLYVALSRVRKLEDLYLFNPLSKRDVQASQPKATTKNEILRLLRKFDISELTEPLKSKAIAWIEKELSYV